MPNVTDTVVPPQLARSIDPVCDAFELAWREGRRPAIEDQIGSVVEAVRPLLLVELIRTELEWRHRLGELPTPEEYRTRFPTSADTIEEWLTEARTAAEEVTRCPVLDTDGPGLAATGTFQPGQPSAAVAPPAVLGEYELLEQLGAGGMGEVYRARHRRLDKLVALKLLRARSPGSADGVARFLREMKAIGSLDHRNVVEAHDAGEQDGVVYLVMKLIAGADLARVVRERGPLPVAEACDLARQAALGLQYLHERGLVHRDLKPSNLMRTPDGTVKILDLGLARWREERPDDDLTGVGQTMGTPDYLAPEQIRSAADVDIRADLYGLGATLFFLLTARPPFAHRRGSYEKMKAHEEESPPDVRSLRAEVPAALAALVARLLAKDPRDRPQTPDEVADELADFAQGNTPAEPTVPAPAIRRPLRARHRRAWLAAKVSVLATVLGLAGIAIYHFQNAPTKPLDPVEAAIQRKKLEMQKLEMAPAPKLRVESLDVTRWVKVPGGDVPRGLLGKEAFGTLLHDTVTVEAKLSRPAYAFLIAFRPDGTDEVCFPESEDEAPPLDDRPRYPSKSRNVNYGLDEGAGLQVFVLVVSRRPLPSYKEWRAQRGSSPWERSAHAASVASTIGWLGAPHGQGPLLAAAARFPGRTEPFETPPGVVWRDDGVDLDALTAENPNGRGKGVEVPGKAPLANLTDWLRQAPDVEAVQALGFGVWPKGRP